MVLAIAMSENFQTTHVHYIPAGTHYTDMLKTLVFKKVVEPKGTNFYKLTKSGWVYLKKLNITKLQLLDKEIDAFVDAL
jgi:hypothetical protein